MRWRRRQKNGLSALWLQSGSATVDLMMHWVAAAMAAKDYALALDYLDRIVTMKPDYAEGWNKRATVYFLTGDYAKRSSTSTQDAGARAAPFRCAGGSRPHHARDRQGQGALARLRGRRWRSIRISRTSRRRWTISEAKATAAQYDRRASAARRRSRRRTAMRSMLVAPGVPSGTPAVMMMRSPGSAKPSSTAMPAGVLDHVRRGSSAPRRRRSAGPRPATAGAPSRRPATAR